MKIVSRTDRNTRQVIAVIAAVLAGTSFFPLALSAAQGIPEQELRETYVESPCEGCEGIFVGLPDSIPSQTRIASLNEPGEPMVISGTVYDREGEVAPGVVVYAYHTNAEGIYPAVEKLRGTEAYRHGGLRGWARTDEDGRYQFRTIRPGAYPSGNNPQHVHMLIFEVGCCTYYLSSIKFADDPMLSAADREETRQGRGGDALVTPRRDDDGAWIVERDIFLGRRVPGYPWGARRPR